MSDRSDSRSSHQSKYSEKSKKGFTACESDHIQVRKSNGSSSVNRYNPYGRPNSNLTSEIPDSTKQENINSNSTATDKKSGNESCPGDVKSPEKIPHVPVQNYTSTEAKSSPPKVTEQKSSKKKMTVASVFNCDSSEEEEEIPMQAKMRMRNIGKNTPTSSGPNSFGKTKQGFTDTVKLWEKDPVKVAKTIVGKRREPEAGERAN